MKSLTKFLFLSITFSLSGFFAIADNHIKTLVIKTAIYCDHCKECESCGSRVENAVYNLKGIKRVDVNDKEMTVTVVYNEQKTKPEIIRQVIAATGYDADDIKATPEAIAKLDGCCRK